MTIYNAIDVLKLTDFGALHGRRYGLLTHVAACDTHLVPTYARLAAQPETRPRALFSPEHGLLATAPDGVHIGHSVDARTKLPIHSLYGENKKPSQEMFDGLDLIVVDLADVGARFYTYIWTLALMLEACGEYGIEVVVLDRPNPLGGFRTGGLYVAPDCTSFVGWYADCLPVMHGMTIGELARFFNNEFNPKPCMLSVVSASGWKREQLWPQTGLTWVPPSPAMPQHTTAWQYPGAALLEGTTLSEGRGTSLPFEVAGAPGIDAFYLAERLNMQHMIGVRFRPHAFRPTASKYAGQDCQGVQAHITNPAYFNPLRTWLSVIVTINALYPESFGWIAPVNGHQHFDLLFGDTSARQMIDEGARADDILADERQTIAHFEERRKPYLLYA